MQASNGAMDCVCAAAYGEKIRLLIQDNKRLKKDWQIRCAPLPTSQPLR